MDPLDWTALREQCGGDESLVREVIELYRREWAALLHDVQQAVGAGDVAAVRRSAHRLKGALLSLAASPSAGLAQRLEAAAASNEQANFAPLLRELERELSRVATAIS
ncbi:MAG: Hpt domain-containing protein [Myxococcota bacterium]